MSLAHPEYLPALGHVSVIITFVVALGVLSLMFALINKNKFGSGSSDKKDDHKTPDSAKDPTNFFDSTTATLVDASANDEDSDSAKEPTNFFDSTTATLAGKDSAAQLSQLNEIQNPHNFLDYWADAVLGIKGIPPEPYLPNPGIDVPSIPGEPAVPFGAAAGAGTPAALREVAVEREKKLEEVKLEAKKEEIKQREEGKRIQEERSDQVKIKAEEQVKKIELKERFELAQLKRFELKDEFEGIRKEAVLRRAKEFENRHELILILNSQEAENIKAKEEAARKEANKKALKGGGGKGEHEKNSHFMPEKELVESIKVVQGLIRGLMEIEKSNPPVFIMLQKADKALDDLVKKGEKLKKDVEETVRNALLKSGHPEWAEVLDYKEELEAKQKKTEEKIAKPPEGKAPDAKPADDNSAYNNPDLNKALIVIKNNCSTVIGINPVILSGQNYQLNYARAC